MKNGKNEENRAREEYLNIHGSQEQFAVEIKQVWVVVTWYNRSKVVQTYKIVGKKPEGLPSRPLSELSVEYQNHLTQKVLDEAEIIKLLELEMEKK